MKAAIRNKILFMAILALGVVLRFHFTDWGKVESESKIHVRLAGDEVGYDKSARQLLEHRVYGYAPYSASRQPNAFTTPGYTLFLAAIYAIAGYGDRPPIIPIQAIQVILDIISGMMLFGMACKLTRHECISCFVMFLYMIHPTFIFTPSYLLTETLYGFLFISFAACLLSFLECAESRKPLMGVLLGIAFGAVILVRPAVFPFILIFIAVRLLKPFRTKSLSGVKPLVCIIAGVMTVMLPWWIRNEVTLHKQVLLAEQTGNPLLWGTYPYEENPQIDVAAPPSEMKRLAVARIKEGFHTNPLLYAKWYTIGKAAVLVKHIYAGFARISNPLLIKIHHWEIAAGSLGLCVSLLSWVRTGKETAMAWIAVLACISFAVYVPFAPTNRYFYSVIPLCFIGIGHLLVQLREFAKRLIPQSFKLT